MTEPSAARDVGPGALDEHLPIPSTRVAVMDLLTRDAASIGLTVAALTAATFLLELLGAFGAGLALGLVAAYALAVVRSAAHGAPWLPDAADFTGLESWLVPLAQVGLALLPSAALVAWDYAAESPRFVLASLEVVPEFRWTRARWLLAAAGLPLAAPGILAAALTEHPLAPLHAPLTVKLALRAPTTCLRVALALLGAWLVASAATAATEVATGGPIAGAVAVALIRGSAILAFSLLAFAMGWTVYRRADDFGIRRRPEHVRRHFAFAPAEPVDPDVDVEAKPRLLRDRR